MPIQWICELINLAITRPSPEKFLSSFFQKNLALVRQRLKLDPDAVKIEQSWEEKLSLIRYFSENHSHIKVFRPENFENRAKNRRLSPLARLSRESLRVPHRRPWASPNSS